MDKDEKLFRLHVLEEELKAKWIDFISKEVDEKLPKDLGVIDVAFKDKDTEVLIYIDNTKESLMRFEIDDIHVWHYIVNELYRDKVKIVGVDLNRRRDNYVPLTFDCNFNEQFSRIYNNEEFTELVKEIYATEIK